MKRWNKLLLPVVLCLVAVAMTACGDDDEPQYKIKGDAIDLGLSVNWSSQNLGATNTASYGSLHCWGDSVGGNSTLEGIRVYFRMEDGVEKTYCEWNTTRYGGNNPPMSISGSLLDYARNHWGSLWRLPTKAEWQELIDRCAWTETTQEGIKGVQVTGPNGNSIFLPYSGVRDTGSVTMKNVIGMYWTDASLTAAEQTANNIVSTVRCCAWAVEIHDGKPQFVPQLRCNGLSLRPVIAK